MAHWESETLHTSTPTTGEESSLPPRSCSALISHRWIENETVTLGDINYNRRADWLGNKRFFPPALRPTLSTELSRCKRFALLCSVCKHVGITTRRRELKWDLTVAGSPNLQCYCILQKCLSHAALTDATSAFRDASSERILEVRGVRCSTRLLPLWGYKLMGIRFHCRSFWRF